MSSLATLAPQVAERRYSEAKKAALQRNMGPLRPPSGGAPAFDDSLDDLGSGVAAAAAAKPPTFGVYYQT